jgi:hypothetical protein
LSQCEQKKVEVKVKNFSNTSQTRNVQLFLDGSPIGGGQLITVAAGKEMNVTFNITATGATAGTHTLTASLYPNDSNPSNDSLSKSVKVKECKDKDKDKGKDK